MTRLCAVLTALVLVCAGSLAAQTPRIIALVVTAETESPEADALVRSLRRVDAEVLRVGDPANAELRALMRRFADEAAEADAALVYVDLATVALDGRSFVLTSDARLSRATDLFTQGVPLRAFARMTALASRGGAVIVAARAPDATVPEVARPDVAPAPVPGTSEILFAPAEDIIGFLEVFDEITLREPSVDLARVLEVAARQEPISLSAAPPSEIILKAPIVLEPPIDVIPEPEITAAPEDEPVSEEELALLEQSLSPAVKRDLQRALRGLGHYSGLIDGIIGGQTRAAIVDFQAAQDAVTTGFLTLRQLRELLANG